MYSPLSTQSVCPYSLMANRTGSVTLECHPDSSTILILYSGYGALIRYVHNLYYPQCRPRSTTQSRLNSQIGSQFRDHQMSRQKKTVATALRPSFAYTVRGDHETAEYTVFDLSHGSGFRRQVYVVGLGATATKGTQFPQPIIMKVYCRGEGRRFKEEDILQEIHKDGFLPGVPRIAKCVLEQRFPLPRNDALDLSREACIMSLATTGQSLSMCKNVLHFLSVMYDLVEGLCQNSLIHADTNEYQFIAASWKKGILHRDISWGNILINHKHF